MLTPRQISLKDIFINSLWSLWAWIIWSIVILFLVFLISWVVDIPAGFDSMRIWANTNAIFPIILSVIALIWTILTVFITYYIITLTDPEKYKRNLVIYGQIAFYSIMVYIFITPVYIVMGLENYNNIIYIFLFHILILSFWVSIIIEILNNYTYILVWVYWSFIGLFGSIILTLFIYNSFPWGYAKLISLVILLPVINFLQTFFKQLFEFIYFHYYRITWMDNIWDIFRTIENEEKEKQREEEEKNMI